MSSTYIQILELASSLSNEERLMLIKDISTALVEDRKMISIPKEIERKILKSALQTQAKVQSGEMKTFSLTEAKSMVNG